MGAWGYDALDSDQALDWLGDITHPIAEEIRAMLDKFFRTVDEEGGEVEMAADNAHELRAAAHVVLALNFFNERIFGDLHGDLAKALTLIRDSDWPEGWRDPNAVRESLSTQIVTLEAGRQPTTLFERLRETEDRERGN